MRIASNYKCSHRYCSFFPLLACSQLTLTAMGRATDARSRSPSLSNQIAREGSLPPMTNSNSSSKLARCLFKGWGLIDLPLRASNEGLLRPRVARAQKIIRLHPLLCSGSTGPTWVAIQESPISHTALKRSGQAALYCAHRTSTFRSCAFREQEDCQTASLLIWSRGLGARRQSSATVTLKGYDLMFSRKNSAMASFPTWPWAACKTSVSNTDSPATSVKPFSFKNTNAAIAPVRLLPSIKG